MILYASAQMIYFAIILIAPMIHVARKNINIKSTLSLALVLLVCFGTSQSVHEPNKEPNRFNRFYNGLGWTELNSSSWPGRDFVQRHRYFYSNIYDPKIIENKNYISYLMGTSFWPTGQALAEQAWGPSTPPEQVQFLRLQYSEILSRGEFKNYFSYLIYNPNLLYRFFVNSFAMAWSSDYSIKYLRKPIGVENSVSRFVNEASIALSQNSGKVMIIILIMGILCVKSSWIVISFIFFLLSPVAVAIGDGFYEYEKHLLRFFMFKPFFVYISYNNWSRLRKGS
jgi:hypothetical protein